MASYAALVSLLRILGTPPDRGRFLIFNNNSQLQSLHQKAIYLLEFLENSSTSEAAVETKIREAAYMAEDLIEFRTFRTDSISLLNSFKSWFPTVLFFSIALIFASNLFPLSLTKMRVLCVVTTFLLVVITGPIRAINLFQEQDTPHLRRILYAFDNIVKEVAEINETRLDMEMSAYAALISLRKILNFNLNCGSTYSRSQLEFLHQKVIFLLDFLENCSTYMTSHKSELEIVEVKINESVLRSKALPKLKIGALLIMGSYRRSFWELVRSSLPARLLFVSFFLIITQLFLQLIVASLDHEIANYMAALLCTSSLVLAIKVREASEDPVLDNQDLRQLIDDFSVIVGYVVEIKDACRKPNNLPATATVAGPCSWGLGGTGRKVVVGLDSDLEQIRDRLTRDSSKLEVVSIVGMGGIGKTTLANKVFEDPYIVHRFDVRAWITVSQERPFRDILLGLLDSAKKLTKEMLQEENDDRLATELHQHLIGRTYLIVMDDVWDIEIWDSVKNYFPENNNGSRVLLTSRLNHVASHPKSCTILHQMKCLNADRSWDLLCGKVFGAETCPLELESIGKDIARRCSGLPLAIIVIGGLLCKDKRSEIWREIARDISSKLGRSKERYLEILGLSYNHLPPHLRPCFLYMGAFVGDSKISVSKLISLWVAEGFLKPSTSKTLEKVAEDNLKNLIDRNLISVCKRSCNDKIRTCSMHGLLGDVSRLKACEEGFLHVVQWRVNVRHGETLRRASIRSDARLVDSGPSSRQDHLLSHCYYVRSFLDHHVAYLVHVRVLDVLVVRFSKFPDQIMGLVLLRYLAFHCDGLLPTTMSKLQNLETIVYHHSSCRTRNYPLFQSVIWSMPSLRHFYVKPGCYLSAPLGLTLPWNKSAFKHLQTLVGIRNFRWSKGIIKRISNLKKLGVSYDVSSSVDWAAYQLENLVHLLQLESLEISIQYNDEGSAITRNPPKLAFPQQLRKLSLSGGGIPWASIGGLPNLEALKLRCEACSGESWETAEGEFPQLIFLLLEKMSLRRWETLADHFPRLKRVVIRSCGMLEEIPEAIGEIPALEMIHLVDCPASVVDSAIQIRDDQEYMGNESLKVCTAEVAVL